MYLAFISPRVILSNKSTSYYLETRNEAIEFGIASFAQERKGS